MNSGRNPDTYTIDDIKRLLGLHEDPGPSGERDVTIADILSWANDAGGMHLVNRQEAEAWMARRGPLDPDSPEACILYDFQRAMKELPLAEEAIIALTAMGFSPTDIAAVVDPDAVLDLRQTLDYREAMRLKKLLDSRRKRISRLIKGRPRRDAHGQVVRDERGVIVRTTGQAVKDLHRGMNRES